VLHTINLGMQHMKPQNPVVGRRAVVQGRLEAGKASRSTPKISSASFSEVEVLQLVDFKVQYLNTSLVGPEGLEEPVLGVVRAGVAACKPP
jgi:hypothetical protein